MSDEQLCRLCARHTPVLLDITTSNEDDCALVDLIHQYLALKVVAADGYPSVACSECSDMLITFHRFAIRCRDAQRTLQDRLRAVVELCKPEVSGVEQDLFKRENIKEECEDEDALSDNVQGFDYSISYDDWVQNEPEISIKLRKKKRKSKLKLKSDRISNYIKIENKEIKEENYTNSIVISKRKYIKSGKFKKNPANRGRIKRTYTRKDISENEVEPSLRKCYVCGDENFTTRASLHEHERSHLVMGNKYPWPCINCNKTYRDKTSALRHIRAVHEGAADFVCHTCGRTFLTKGNLDGHLNTHSELRPFQCDQCHKKFKGKPSLKRHMDTHRDTVYQCPKCALLLNSRVTLRNHLHTHDEIGQQECHYCGKRFKTRKALKVHLLTHTGERPFSCPWCPKTFANNSNCRIHKKRVHMPELMKFEAERAAKLANQYESSEERQTTTADSSQDNISYGKDSFDLQSLIKLRECQTTSMAHALKSLSGDLCDNESVIRLREH